MIGKRPRRRRKSRKRRKRRSRRAQDVKRALRCSIGMEPKEAPCFVALSMLEGIDVGVESQELRPRKKRRRRR